MVVVSFRIVHPQKSVTNWDNVNLDAGGQNNLWHGIGDAYQGLYNTPAPRDKLMSVTCRGTALNADDVVKWSNYKDEQFTVLFKGLPPTTGLKAAPQNWPKTFSLRGGRRRRRKTKRKGSKKRRSRRSRKTRMRR